MGRKMGRLNTCSALLLDHPPAGQPHVGTMMMSPRNVGCVASRRHIQNATYPVGHGNWKTRGQEMWDPHEVRRAAGPSHPGRWASPGKHFHAEGRSVHGHPRRRHPCPVRESGSLGSGRSVGWHGLRLSSLRSWFLGVRRCSNIDRAERCRVSHDSCSVSVGGRDGMR